MLDYTKITFNELDDTNDPVQIFYNYDLRENEIDDFLEECATVDEVPENTSIQKVELCLTIYTRYDFKLEACCTDANNNQYWIDINEQFANADEFLKFNKLKIGGKTTMIKEFAMSFDELKEKYRVGQIEEIDGEKFKVVEVLDALPVTCFPSFPRVVFEEADFVDELIESLEKESSAGYTGENRVIIPIDYEDLQRKADRDRFY